MNIGLPYKLYDFLISHNHPLWQKIMVWGTAHRAKTFTLTLPPYASYQLRQEAERLVKELKALYQEVKCSRKS